MIDDDRPDQPDDDETPTPAPVPAQEDADEGKPPEEISPGQIV